jgi:ribose-phosphate pyrophosphokinase
MFYKRRDYSRIVNGKNPIVAHEYLGRDVNGKDVIIVDDMISSGESIIDVGKSLNKQGAKRIFVFSSFGLFVNGLDVIDKAYEDGVIDKIFTTNLIYRQPGLKERAWYYEVDMSKYVALLVDTLNHDETISRLLDPAAKIHRLVDGMGGNNA